MRIDSKDNIAGISILAVRRLLKKKYNSDWTVVGASDVLEISQEETLKLLGELHAQGYIKPVGIRGERQYWRNTIKGNALANATAAKPIGRPKADKAFAEFMERVNQVNQDPYFLYKVVKVVLFGSYLTDVPTVNDIDLGIELDTKEKDPDLLHDLFEKRRREALEKGVNLDNTMMYSCWPEIEVQRFLKARSRVISLHPLYEAMHVSSSCKIVYDENQNG